MERGGDPSRAYMLIYLARKSGARLCHVRQDADLPRHYPRLVVMLDIQTQHWSLVSCDIPVVHRLVRDDHRKAVDAGFLGDRARFLHIMRVLGNRGSDGADRTIAEST